MLVIDPTQPIMQWPYMQFGSTVAGKPVIRPNGTNAMHRDRLGDSIHGRLLVEYVSSEPGTLFEFEDPTGQTRYARVVLRNHDHAVCWALRCE